MKVIEVVMYNKLKMRIKKFINEAKNYYSITNYILRPQVRQIFILIIMSIILSFVEAGGITIIAPFLSVLANKNIIMSNSYFKLIYDFFKFPNIDSFFIAFGLVLIIFYVFRAIYDLLFYYFVNKTVYDFYHRIIIEIIYKYIHQPYQDFVNRNVSDLTKTVVAETNQLSMLLNNMIVLVSEIMVFSLLFITMIIVNWKIAMALTIIGGLSLIIFSMPISFKIKRMGDKREDLFKLLFKKLAEFFGNFKIIKLSCYKNEILNEFSHIAYECSRTDIAHHVLGKIPKNVIEGGGFSCLIGVVVVSLFFKADLGSLLPTLTIFALAMYRLLPSINKIVMSFNSIAFFSESIKKVYTELMVLEEEEKYEKIDFTEKIEFKNVIFSYNADKNAIDGLDVIIKKGGKIGFSGESGSGKSTLVDLISGIYFPKEGQILVDGKKLTNDNIGTWRNKIGYIPQSIYLLDGTVAENVVFGSRYSEERIIRALKKARIYSLLLEKEGLNTMVGDGGIKLSGGQRQRIGIARALYTDPEILIMDEPTSALDYEIEKEIIDEIFELCKDKTLIIVAHRLNTIESCDLIYHLQYGKIIKKIG